MRTLESFSDATWDKFFDFLADGVMDLTQAEVEEGLREAGIDTTDAKRRLGEMIGSYERPPNRDP